MWVCVWGGGVDYIYTIPPISWIWIKGCELIHSPTLGIGWIQVFQLFTYKSHVYYMIKKLWGGSNVRSWLPSSMQYALTVCTKLHIAETQIIVYWALNFFDVGNVVLPFFYWLLDCLLMSWAVNLLPWSPASCLFAYDVKCTVPLMS